MSPATSKEALRAKKITVWAIEKILNTVTKIKWHLYREKHYKKFTTVQCSVQCGETAAYYLICICSCISYNLFDFRVLCLRDDPLSERMLNDTVIYFRFTVNICQNPV